MHAMATAAPQKRQHTRDPRRAPYRLSRHVRVPAGSTLALVTRRDSASIRNSTSPALALYGVGTCTPLQSMLMRPWIGRRACCPATARPGSSTQRLCSACRWRACRTTRTVRRAVTAACSWHRRSRDHPRLWARCRSSAVAHLAAHHANGALPRLVESRLCAAGRPVHTAQRPGHIWTSSRQSRQPLQPRPRHVARIREGRCRGHRWRCPRYHTLCSARRARHRCTV